MDGNNRLASARVSPFLVTASLSRENKAMLA